ncbi:hypothetical protein D049_0635B, partial [Vibrio parahaemolyticus VPTS-2010]
VTDVGVCLSKVRVLVHEIPVDCIVFDDVVRDEVSNRKVRLWVKNVAVICQLE